MIGFSNGQEITMVSVERPSEIGTPQWNGAQQRQLRFALDTAEVDSVSRERIPHSS